jgi:hypothetical protein
MGTQNMQESPPKLISLSILLSIPWDIECTYVACKKLDHATPNLHALCMTYISLI